MNDSLGTQGRYTKHPYIYKIHEPQTPAPNQCNVTGVLSHAIIIKNNNIL